MNELVKPQKAIVMRGDVVIWLDSEKSAMIEKKLITQTSHSFIRINELDITINTADIIGAFTPEMMEAKTRRQNGEWQCQKGGNWHGRKDKCECVDKSLIKQKLQEAELYAQQYGAWPLWYNHEWRKQVDE